MLDNVIILVIEEHCSSANFHQDSSNVKKVGLKLFEMHIGLLGFYFVGQP